MPHVPLSYEERKDAQARAIANSLATRRAKQKDRGPMTYIRISKSDLARINAAAAANRMSQIDALSAIVKNCCPALPETAPVAPATATASAQTVFAPDPFGQRAERE